MKITNPPANHDELGGVSTSDHHTVYSDANARAAAVEDTAYASGWNGDTTHAPSQNAVYDQIELITFTAADARTAAVEDAAYAVGWNGDTTHAPSQNAVYDKVETLFADQAAVEAASADTSFVTPGRVKYHPGVAKAWLKMTGGDGETEKSHNSSCTAHNGDGDYTWTIDIDLSATDYVVIPACEGSADRTATASVISSTRIDIFTRTAGTLANLSSHTVVFGDHS